MIGSKAPDFMSGSASRLFKEHAVVLMSFHHWS